MYKKLVILMSLCGITQISVAMQQEIDEPTIWRQYTELMDMRNPLHPLANPESGERVIQHLSRLRRSDNRELALRATVELASFMVLVGSNQTSNQLMINALKPIAATDPTIFITQESSLCTIAQAKYFLAYFTRLELQDARALELYQDAAVFIRTYLPQATNRQFTAASLLAPSPLDKVKSNYHDMLAQVQRYYNVTI